MCLKFNLLVVKCIVFCGIFLCPYVQAAVNKPVPQAAQLLPHNARANVQTFPNHININIKQRLPLKKGCDKEKVYVRKIKIVGNTLFDTSTLENLVVDARNKALTLCQLQELTARISHHYQQHGYLFSRAYIPMQVIKNGLIQFNILEARYADIRIKNRSRLACNRVNLYLKPLHKHDIIEMSKLNRSLFLLNDLSGIVTHSVMSPGKSVGTSNLQLSLEPTPLINGFVGVDNYGTYYTGKTRYNASVLFNNPLGQGDKIAIEGVSSGRALIYGHVGYNFPLYPALNIGTNYYGTTYRLEGDMNILQTEGKLNIADVWLSYDWVRRTHVNFNSILRYVHKNMNDRVQAADIYKMRYSNAVRLENSAEFRDPYGNTHLYLAIAQGVLNLNNASNNFGMDSSVPVAAHTLGGFTRVNFHLSRTQQLTENNALYLGGDGQLANKNLDSSEQLVLGGPFITRSYDVGALSGTQGYSVSTELRHVICTPMAGSWRSLLFVDAGRVQIYKHPISPEPNVFNLYSAGIGLDVIWKGWTLSSRYGHQIASALPPSIANLLGKDKVWIQLGKNF